MFLKEYINSEDPLPSDFNSVLDRHAQTLFLTEIMRGECCVCLYSVEVTVCMYCVVAKP